MSDDNITPQALVGSTTALHLAAQVKPIFAGYSPDIIGGALADLLATYIAGHRPDVRDEVLENLITTAGQLVPIIEREIFAAHRSTDPWSMS
jgi:hypothetical protein